MLFDRGGVFWGLFDLMLVADLEHGISDLLFLGIRRVI